MWTTVIFASGGYEMQELFYPVLRRYGREAMVEHNGSKSGRLALVQPVTGERGPQESGGPLGRVDERLWLYIGQGPLEAGDSVMWNEMQFLVQSAAEVLVGDRVSHWQAALRRKREAAV